MQQTSLALMVGTALVSLAAAACSSNDRAPYVDPDARNSGGARDAPDHGPTIGEVTGEDGGATGTDPQIIEPVDFGDGAFTRGDIYMLGKLRVEHEDDWAITRALAPKDFFTGFVSSGDAGGYIEPFRAHAFDGSRLIYAANAITLSNAARRFVVDGSGTGELTGTYPEAPADNDPIVETPRCPESVNGLLTSPGGRMIYRCGAREWYEGDKVVLDQENAFAFADEGYVLYSSIGVPINIKHIDGGDDEDFVVDVAIFGAARAFGSEFHAAVGRSDGTFELVHIRHDGTFSSLGTFPPGNDQVVRSAVLDGEDRFYQLASPGHLYPPLELKRFSVGGTMEVLMDYGEGATEPVLLMAP